MSAPPSSQRRSALVAVLALVLILAAFLPLWANLPATGDATAGVTVKVVAYARQLLVATGIILLVGAAFYHWPPLHLQAWAAAPRRWPAWGVAAAILLYIAVYFPFTLQRWLNFNAGAYDLGIQDQVVWNLAHGHGYASSVEVHNYLADHFKPLIALFAPLYWLYPSAAWLLAFQTIALALAAIPVYLLAARRLPGSLFGLLFALLFLLYPSTGYLNRFDFHWEVTVIPLLLAAIVAADRNALGWASLWLALALLAKEEIGLTVAAYALWLAWQGHRRFGLTWAVIGVAFSLTLLFAVIPALRQASSDTLARYAWLGATPAAMAATLIFQPYLAFSHLFGLDAIRLVAALIAPLLFLPAFSTLILPALPALLYNLLSDFGEQHVVYYQYIAPIVPFVFAAAILALQRAFTWAQRRHALWFPWTLCAGLLLFTLWHTTLVHNPLADDGAVQPAWTRQPNAAAIREALALIPPQAAVFTTNAYASHLAHRPNLSVWFDPPDLERLPAADYALFNTLDYRSHHAWACADYADALAHAHALGFGLTFAQDRVVVIQRQGGDRAALGSLIPQLCTQAEP